tara:strand:- start:64 stop:2004 length:1941 start_codon:yes stop_codon:yes gene_type:complete
VDKEAIYDDFLKSLRVALTNTSVYFKEHPLFLKAIGELKANTDKLLVISDKILIGITKEAILIGEDQVKDSNLTKNLADFFHLRKIKSLEIKKNVTVEDLIVCLSSVNISPSKIAIQGGVANIIKKVGVLNIVISDLDYSQLLQADGTEYKDMWMFLLGDSLKSDNSNRIKELADNFEKVLKKMKLEELLNDKEVGILINNFFAYLKKIDKERFLSCAQDLTKVILKAKALPKKENLELIKSIFGHIEPEDISEILAKIIEGNDNIDDVNFSLFSTLFGSKEHSKIASNLAKNFDAKGFLGKNPQTIIRMRELFSMEGNPFIVEIYRKNLSFLIDGVRFGKGFNFDKNILKRNYQLVLLDLFNLEFNNNEVLAILDVILARLKESLNENDLKFVKDFIELVHNKNNNSAKENEYFKAIQEKISGFVEQAVFAKDSLANLEWFIGLMTSSTQDYKFYLEKIFKEEKISSTTLKLFFKFFPDKISSFYASLERESFNVDFLKKIMNSLVGIKKEICLDIFKRIYNISNNYLRLEVLKRMHNLALVDAAFLASIIKKENFFQRKAALMALVNNPESRKKIAGELLAITNPFGIRTKTICENLHLINEVPFKEAQPYLTALTKYRFFWNRTIRKIAGNIINEIESMIKPN